MDSEGVQQAAAMNGSTDEKNKLDLALRLGLPDNGENPPKDQGQQFDPALLATDNNVDLSHLALRSQGEKDNHVPHGGVHINADALPLELGIHDYYANPTKHCASSTGIDLSPNNPPVFPGWPLMVVSNTSNLFVDISQENNMVLGTSSSFGRPPKLPIRRRRQGHDATDNSTNRCANPLCNATTSPMWRRGPLGPKTLCNACGIKYRKEEEKRRTQAIMMQLHELATARHKPAA
ncbi:GATA transcription factor 29-like [Syzygium oleosum]|uniref:GATA transcription factor 29-like n=1 Tax=Syzygium oleosum TaxID=219896 RepID=UPI0011D222A6|nr:GATA transcription factor 29-like [Syzygium oleosum]